MKKLDQYRGRLNPAQVAEGMNAATRNARRLAEDAATLLEAGRYASAAALAILSIEEAGKLPVLRSLAMADRDEQIGEEWRAYRSHTRKNVIWLLPQLVARGARKLDDFAGLFDKDASHPYVLDQVKQIAVYSDCLGDGHWSIPDLVIDKSLATGVVEVAQTLCPTRETTNKEIELWIKHLRPVWMTDPSLMRNALEAWYAAMQEHGLIPDGSNRMEEFVRGGLSDLGPE